MIMILKRSSLVLLFMILIVAGLTSGIVVRYFPYAQTIRMHSDSPFTVIVDAGHGNPDGGSVGISGIIEKDINLAIALKVQEVLEAKGINVIMTRTGDNGIYDGDAKTIREKKRSDMNNRLAIMKKSNADLFVSIHMNSFESSKASGLNVFYSKNHPDIKSLADAVQTRMGEITKAPTHVVKTADSKLFLMKNPPLPSLLIECGFLSNKEEERKLSNEQYQAKLAWAIADAIDRYHTP